MKSFLSLLATLAVVGALAAGGYWLYQQAAPANSSGAPGLGGNSGGAGAHTLSAVSTGASFTLTNGTHYVLTVTMRQGTELVRFEIAPGHSETKPVSAGTYAVEGKISDPKTDPFTAQWEFKAGGKYNANFSVDANTGQVGMLVKASDLGKSTGGTPSPPRRSH